VNISWLNATRAHDLLFQLVGRDALIGSNSDVETSLLVHHHRLSWLTLTLTTSFTTFTTTLGLLTTTTPASSVALFLIALSVKPFASIVERVLAVRTSSTSIIAIPTITAVITITTVITVPAVITTATSLAATAPIVYTTTIAAITISILTIEVWLTYIVLILILKLRPLLAYWINRRLKSWDYRKCVA
jgi:hypothetical protein